jgi:hypothetical protein
MSKPIRPQLKLNITPRIGKYQEGFSARRVIARENSRGGAEPWRMGGKEIWLRLSKKAGFGNFILKTEMNYRGRRDRRGKMDNRE